MPNDPGLANDTCIFMEAIPGDGGNQNPNDVWWLSPDINLVGPVSGADNADAGQINPVRVKFHRKSANSNCHFPGDESLTVELWVANPSLVMSPRVGAAPRESDLLARLCRPKVAMERNRSIGTCRRRHLPMILKARVTSVWSRGVIPTVARPSTPASSCPAISISRSITSASFQQRATVLDSRSRR